jgi:drug/metabolite transporter (DMT)-like permease
MTRAALLAEKRLHYRRGALAMVGGAMFFSLMDSMLKLLSAHYPPMQVTALRFSTLQNR